MKIAVCDDEKAMRDELVYMIKRQMEDARISVFESAKEMTAAAGDFDLFFLDIEMKEMSGMEAARNIRARQEKDGRKSLIIFITGYREYMAEAFDVNAYHYLLKPVDREKFGTVFRRARKEIMREKEQNGKYLMVKNRGIWQKIFLKDIYYIESSNKKVIIHTKDKATEGYGKMEELEKELSGYFYRCHRCYLVNMEKISAYSADTIQVLNGDKLFLARKKYPDFVRSYMNYARNGGIVNV